jgi:hypothetical protein
VRFRLLSGMTKVDLHFRLQSPLTELQLARLSDLRGVYGVLAFRLEDGALGVEYDATRLRPAEIETLLHRAGIPALPA